MIYNDGYSAFAGGRHPNLFGSKVREGWPEVADFNDNIMKVRRPRQYHLDFRAPDLEKATEHAIGLGATQAEEQPNEKLWRVMIDPDGHPFCLCPPRD